MENSVVPLLYSEEVGQVWIDKRASMMKEVSFLSELSLKQNRE